MLQPEKYQQLAQAISLYLNGDYQKILNNYNLTGREEEDGTGEGDFSCDPDQMMKQSTDVDEWLLSGASETDIYLRNTSNKNLVGNNSGLGLLERDEEEENMIMRKIEEN